MSHKYNDDNDQRGLSSSSSSSSTTSGSPTPRRRRQRRYSRSSSSSLSSSSSSERSRSPFKPKPKEENSRRIYVQKDRLSSEDVIDDSIRSAKSSKSAYEGIKETASGNNEDSQAIGQPKPPPPPKITTKAAAIQFGKPGTIARPGIHMKLATHKPKKETTKKITVASAFNNDSDEEVEEMPPECKMRMRNIGRDTPTSSGPNSFGKTKQGFIDSKKLFEKNLRDVTSD